MTITITHQELKWAFFFVLYSMIALFSYCLVRLDLANNPASRCLRCNSLMVYHRTKRNGKAWAIYSHCMRSKCRAVEMVSTNVGAGG